MQQVFSVLPVMADDHAAYLAFHKAESEKRLNAQKAKQQPPPPEKKPNPAPRRRDPNLVNKAVDQPSSDNTASLETKGEQNENESSANENDEQGNGNGENDPNQTDATNGEGENADQQEEDEECTPERLEEIKKILIDIYEKYSPEKLNKIDRLLTKYLGHEEEFLQFVFSKYNVSPVLYPSIVKPSLNAKYGYGPQPAVPSSSTNEQSSSNAESDEKNSENASAKDNNSESTTVKSGSQSAKSNNNNARDVS